MGEALVIVLLLLGHHSPSGLQELLVRRGVESRRCRRLLISELYSYGLNVFSPARDSALLSKGHVSLPGSLFRSRLEAGANGGRPHR